MPITLMADREYAAEYLANGAVAVEGFDVEIVWPEGGPPAVYPRLFSDPPYDVMVVPMTNFLIALDNGCPLTGIPVFPDVSFPHVGAQVNVNAGIASPSDLEGKRVGVRGWGFNPGTWLRGAVADVYGVDLTKIHWVEAEPNSLMSADYPRDPRFSISKGGDQRGGVGERGTRRRLLRPLRPAAERPARPAVRGSARRRADLPSASRRVPRERDARRQERDA